MIDSDPWLVVTTQGNSDSDSDSAPLVMVMHSTHGVKCKAVSTHGFNPGLPTLIYRDVATKKKKKKTEAGKAQVFPLWVPSGQCHGVSNDSG